MKKFQRNDLHSGYVVEFRNGIRRIVARAGRFTQILVNPVTGSWNYLGTHWSDDLTVLTSIDAPFGSNEHRITDADLRDHEYDIVKVWGLVNKTIDYKSVVAVNTDCRELLWQRKEPKKLTVDEVSALLGYEVEIVGTKQ